MTKKLDKYNLKKVLYNLNPIRQYLTFGWLQNSKTKNKNKISKICLIHYRSKLGEIYLQLFKVY